MSVARVIGIDPGLVHSGLVALQFDDTARTLQVEHQLVSGPDVDRIKGWTMTGWFVFVEAYRPRLRLNADVTMVQLEQDLRRALPSAKFLPNMGIKQVVTDDLLKLLEVWSFPTVSHHQDLRSAARIALLGMMKHDGLNYVLANAVHDHVEEKPWTISHR